MNKIGINFRIIARIIGFLLLVEAGVMLLVALVPLLYKEQDWLYFLLSSGITLAAGFALFLWGYRSQITFGKKEGYIIVSLVWVVFSLFGMFPFYLSGSIPSLTDAFFETISGFTTTGATSLTDVESLSHGMLFWRSLTHWLGGMGIIVLSVAILPMMGIGGMRLFSAENPSIAVDKLSPRIAETARLLWGVYLLFTLLLIPLLFWGGMPWFDAVCHSFSAISSGGYSTKQESIAYWQSAQIEYTLIPFMFISGCHFTLLYYALHGKFSKMWSNEEFRTYLFSALGFTAVVYTGMALSGEYFGEKAVRTSLFHTISFISSSGFTTVDFSTLHPFVITPLLMLMAMGASAGSTSGGIKVVRIMIALKNTAVEFKRLLHPNAVLPVRLNGQTIPPAIVSNVLAFIILYIIIFAVSIFSVASLSELGLKASFSAVLSCLSNGGVGLGELSSSYASVSEAGKWYLSFLMLVGRLELFTVLLVFTPVFWRK